MRPSGRLLTGGLIILALSMAACEKNDPGVFEPRGVPILPSSGVKALAPGGVPAFVLDNRCSGAKIEFDRSDRALLYNFHPVIRVKRGGSVELFELTDFLNSDWVFAGLSEDCAHVFALLDYAVEGPGWELNLIWSEDGGKSWEHRGDIKKPYYSAYPEKAELKKDGSGFIRMRLDDDGAGRPASYDYQFKDYGRIWMAPSEME